MYGHRISREHTSASCGHMATGHHDDATAVNTFGSSEKDKGWNAVCTRWGEMANLVNCNNNPLLKMILILLYPLVPLAIPPNFRPPTLALPIMAPVDSTLHMALLW